MYERPSPAQAPTQAPALGSQARPCTLSQTSTMSNPVPESLHSAIWSPWHSVWPGTHSAHPRSGAQTTGQTSSVLKPPMPSHTCAVSPSQTMVSSGQTGGAPVVPVSVVSVVLVRSVVALVSSVVPVTLMPSVVLPVVVPVAVPVVVVGWPVVGAVVPVVSSGPEVTDKVVTSVAVGLVVPSSPQA